MSESGTQFPEFKDPFFSQLNETYKIIPFTDSII